MAAGTQMNKTPIWKQLLVSAVLIAVAVGAWRYRAPLMALWQAPAAQADNGGASASGTGVPVLVATVTTDEDRLNFAAVGTGHALRSVTLRAPADGEITELNVIPGRRFAAGDVLMRLDDSDQRLALALAKARQERTESERNRYQGLRDTGVTTAQRFEDAMTADKIALIELDQARADLADRVLRAPFDGIAGLAAVEVGDRITMGDEIARYDDRSQILVEFDLPEALLARTRVGLPVTATTPSTGTRRFEGEIAEIDSRIDAADRTARVRASIRNGADMLRPGASFAVELDLPGATYPLLPDIALQFAGGALQVWRVTEDGRVQPVDVRMVRRRAGVVLVDGPLAVGDRIVVEGLQRLRPGRAVDVLNASDTGAS